VRARKLNGFKAFIFDLDQTLIDSLGRFYVAFIEALKKFKKKPIDYRTFLKLYEDDKLNTLLKGLSLEDFWNYFLKIYDEVNAPPSRPIEGSLELLKKLKVKGIKVAVVTGRRTPKEKLIRVLSDMNFMKYIDLVITAEEDDEISRGFLKVNLLKEVMKRLNVKAEECVYVGDYKPDIISGKTLGFFTIGVLTGKEKPEVLKELGADLVIGKVGDLIDLI